MPGSVQPDEQLDWERRAGRVAGPAAILGALLLVLGGVLNARVTESREFERYLRFDEDPSLVIVPNVVQALGYVGVAIGLFYLARATVARRSEMAGPTRVMAVLGPAANAVSAILLSVAILSIASKVADVPVPQDTRGAPGGASQLLGNQVAGENAVQDFQTDSALYTSAAYVALAANLALGFGLVLVSLNAMRAGLLSRFLGVLGIIAGVLTVLFRGAGIIEAFWLVAVGLIILDRWPGGRGPAWEEVEAIPWPSAADRQRAAMEERGEVVVADATRDDDPVDYEDYEDDEDEELTGPAGGDRGHADGARPHPASKKRKKRKRR